MNEEYLDFIGIYRGTVPDGYCQHVIDEFDRLQLDGAGANRLQREGVLPHCKNDHHMLLEMGMGSYYRDFEGVSVMRHFYNAIQVCFDAYATRFSVLRDEAISGHSVKIQKTAPGGGYHLWHSEQAGSINAARVLTYMLYLNTLEPEEGGETEFLYQRLRLRPEENTMLVWPAAFTHAHRGNMVLGNRAKYVITGWFYYN